MIHDYHAPIMRSLDFTVFLKGCCPEAKYNRDLAFSGSLDFFSANAAVFESEPMKLLE